MKKFIVTEYERIVKFSDIKDIFQETILLCENEEPFMIGAILNNGEIVCIAQFLIVIQQDYFMPNYMEFIIIWIYMKIYSMSIWK